MRRRDVSPITADIVQGIGGIAGGKFTFTSDDNLSTVVPVGGGSGGGSGSIFIDQTYGDMDYHQDYWAREGYYG
jgi:hypothetical protein